MNIVKKLIIINTHGSIKMIQIQVITIYNNTLKFETTFDLFFIFERVLTLEPLRTYPESSGIHTEFGFSNSHRVFF